MSVLPFQAFWQLHPLRGLVVLVDAQCIRKKGMAPRRSSNHLHFRCHHRWWLIDLYMCMCMCIYRYIYIYRWYGQPLQNNLVSGWWILVVQPDRTVYSKTWDADLQSAVKGWDRSQVACKHEWNKWNGCLSNLVESCRSWLGLSLQKKHTATQRTNSTWYDHRRSTL